VQLTPLFDFEIRYVDLEFLDYGAGGQLYGTLDGRLVGEALRGSLRLTNLAPKRPDDVNLPTLRGVLTTDDAAKVYLEINGIAYARLEDGMRVITMSLTFRTGDQRYGWLNTVFAVGEGIIDTVAAGGVVRNRVYRCEPTLQVGDFGPAEAG
jgi:Protein of unknown function (DUF3237)